jgi:tetratricopeptide (TPR) repeat protein
VYREPVDDCAVLFQAGQPDLAAEDIPDRAAAYQEIEAVLAAVGIPADGSLDLAAMPAHVQQQLAPHLAEAVRRPTPPYRPHPGLAAQVAACQAVGLLDLSPDADGEQRLFVHRWTAIELARRADDAPNGTLARAHRQAAAYWQWRIRALPQDRTMDVHDLLEARYHLLQAGETEAAGLLTEQAVHQLDGWGAWDQTASLIHDTLTWLPVRSSRHAVWIHQLGRLAHRRGDYKEAARQYQRSLDIFEQLGDQAGMASGYGNLGIEAQWLGDYEEAARQYQRSLDIKEQIGNRAGMAISYQQLGILAMNRGDYE